MVPSSRRAAAASPCSPATRAGLGRGDEPRADPHAVGTEAQRGGEAAPVEDAAGGDDRHPVADRVDDLRHERHRGDLPGVAAGFGALRDDDVAAGFDRRDGVARPCRTCSRRARRGSWHSSTTSAGTPRPATNTRRALVDEQLDLRRRGRRHRREEVDAERLVGQRLRGADLVDHLVVAHRRRAEAAEAAGLDTAATSRW